MNFVEPIRDEKKISAIKNILKWANNARDFLLFSAGINFWLRISDLLSLKVEDVFNQNGEIKESFEIREQKTKKMNKIGISPKIRDALLWYRDLYPYVTQNPKNYLFFAKKHFPLWSSNIKRNQAWKLIQEWCKSVWLNGKFWTHSFRKTLWFQSLRNNIPVELISHRFNHSDSKITSRYLGITTEETMKAFLALDL